MFIETFFSATGLNFGSGQVLNLTNNEWLDDSDMLFELGLQHDSLRMTVPTNTSQILRSYKSTLTGHSQWLSTQQAERDQIVSVVPVGIDTLILSYRTNGITQLYNQPPLAFELSSGDFDNDGLSDRLEFERGTDIGKRDTDGDGLTDGQEVLITETDPLSGLDGVKDTDGDGLSNRVELNETITKFNVADPADLSADADNDGLSNLIEVTQTLTNPSIKDSDSNGVEDGDEDFDQDGLTNFQELNDTITSLIDAYSVDNITKDGDQDRDGDGLSDGLELNHKNPDTDEPYYDFTEANTDLDAEVALGVVAVNDGDEDFDGDALSNQTEVNITKTDPWLADTDGNGINDGAEDRDSDGLTDRQEIDITFTMFDVYDSYGDYDLDGLPDELVLLVLQSTDLHTSDTDGDGINDYDEVYKYGTNPLDIDTDGDGINDNEEINLVTSTLISDPTSADGDMDGLSDPLELGKVTDPSYPGFLSNPMLSDTDGDGLSDDFEFEYRYEYTAEELEEFGSIIPNIIDPALPDTDGDGLTDSEEISLDTNPGFIDTDSDGLSDFDEVRNDNGSITNPKQKDSDGDGLIDGDEVLVTKTDPMDTDSNDNGILDVDEDSDGDGLTDGEELNIMGTDFDLADKDGDGIPDSDEDADGDTLTNREELDAGTNPLEKDTDGDDLDDNEEIDGGTNPLEEDTDDDGLLDGAEKDFGSNPLEKDTDGDGLGDNEEFKLKSLPNDTDTDNDFLLDGDENGSDVLRWDADDDGIPDGIEEHYLLTNPNNVDSDNDGLLDSDEAWVYALTLNAELPATPIFVGVENEDTGERESTLNSRFGMTGFNPVPFVNNAKDMLVIPLISIEKENAGDVVATLYLRRVSDPSEIDTDGDGLNDFTELKEIEFKYGNHFDPNIGISTYDPNQANSASFFLSDPWELNTPNAAGLRNNINDGDEDIDSDFYSNILEQDDETSNILEPDTDEDGILDGIEVLLLSSKPDFVDSDDDGLRDDEELRKGITDPALKTGAITCRIENVNPTVGCLDFSSERTVIPNTYPCSETEIVLPNIAGVRYCFTINFDSLPSQNDSDSDGVLDPDDAFAMDSTCSLAVNGFTDDISYKKQCFSSWLAEQSEIEQIGHVQWKDNASADQSQIAFFSEGWDKVVRFDTLEARYLTPVMNTPELDLIKVEYSPTNRRLYLAYADGLITYINLVSGDVNEIVLEANASDLNTTLDTIVVAGTSVIVQLKGTTEYTHKILNEAGQQAVDNLSGSEDFNLEDAYWDQATSRLYGFKQAVGQTISNLGFVIIDVSNNQFNGSIVYSTSLSTETGLSGPIALSQDGASVYLGSGHKRLAGLGVGDDVDPRLQKTYKSTIFSSFRELIELGDYFVAVVDLATGSDSINAPTRNGIFIEDLAALNASSSVNNRYLSTVDDGEQVLKLVPFLNGGESELALVSKDSNRVIIEYLGLQDIDNDGMSGIYESFYGLDDTDATDRFGDPDGDLLTNIEEYQYATDPLKEDTDGDTWDDAYEVINSTDPLDSAVF